MKWHIVETEREELLRKLAKPTTRQRASAIANANTSSAPVSPASDTGGNSKGPIFPAVGSIQQGQQQGNHKTRAPLTLEDSKDAVMPNAPRIKYSPRSVTPPPLSSYRPAPVEAYTPDRGSRQPVGRGEPEDSFLRTRRSSLIDSPMLRPPHLRASGIHSEELSGSTQDTTIMSANLSPPSHHPSSSYADDHTAVVAFTPAPQRQHPKLAPPSVSQLPSSYLPTSSPAPFWSYLTWETSPAKGGHLRDLSSPLKLQSSSPPPHDHQGLTDRARELGSPVKERSFGTLQISDQHTVSEELAPALPVDEEDDEGVDDLQGVDLTKLVSFPFSCFLIGPNV